MKKIHALMLALESFLAATASPFIRVFAEATTLEQLQDKLVDVNMKMQSIQARGDAEHRALTAEETESIETLFAEFESVEGEIDRRTRLAETNARLAEGTGRRTEPAAAGSEGEGASAGTGARGGTAARAAASAESRRSPAYTRPRIEDDRRGGFNNLGQFAQAVKVAQRQGGNIDPRLIVLNAAPTTSSEGVGADGGFAVPPDFRAAIMEKVAAETSLLARTDQLQSSTNAITIPKDETTPWQGSGGIQAYWDGENKQKTASKIALESTTIRLNKLSALINVTDELIEDAPALTAYINRKAPIKIDYKITDGIINGTGVGMPTGLLSAAAKIKISKEAGQAAQTVVFNNIVKMWARLYSGCRQTAVWLVNQDIEPQLYGLQFPGTGTAVPVYLPPGGLSAQPFGTLMGRPVIPLESCQTLGAEGDIILTDLQSYMTALKVGGIRQDVSMHLYFDYDVTAFKFVLRVAGQPWWTAAIDPGHGSNKRTCIVTLEDR